MRPQIKSVQIISAKTGAKNVVAVINLSLFSAELRPIKKGPHGKTLQTL